MKGFLIFIVLLLYIMSCKKKDDIPDNCGKTKELIFSRDYIEQDSASIFKDINTVKFTLLVKVWRQCSPSGGFPRDICENNLLSLENLTDKQISVKIKQGIYNIGTIEAIPKAKGDKSVSIVGSVFNCTDISNFQAVVTYK